MRKQIPVTLLTARREMAVALRRAGYSMNSTLKEINRMDSQKHWGKITLRSLSTDISIYYASNQVVTENEKVYLESVRQNYIAQLESTTEELVKLIHKKDSEDCWLPNEKATILEKLHKMQLSNANFESKHLLTSINVVTVNNDITSNDFTSPFDLAKQVEALPKDQMELCGSFISHAIELFDEVGFEEGHKLVGEILQKEIKSKQENESISSATKDEKYY